MKMQNTEAEYLNTNKSGGRTMNEEKKREKTCKRRKK